MEKLNIYFKFLHLAQGIQQLPTFPELDSVEERLLNLCAGIWHSDMKVTITEIAKMLPGTSERTTHRRIKTLLDKNMIVLINDKQDRRIKYIQPTTLCEKYFKKLEDCLLAATK